MLSRTANGLFWMSRYIERAGNIARLLDAGRRMDALPNSDEGRASEWESIVIASGCEETFTHDLKTATMEQVASHLIFDLDNPSSIASCFNAARENARAMRIALTTEVWDAVNMSRSDMNTMGPSDIQGGKFAGFLEWVKSQGHLFHGAVESSMLRGQSSLFVRLGKSFERADATARLIDVKYHVLLPSAQDVGGGLDHMQWVQLLRAANSLRAFRWTYRASVTPNGVVHFLILNKTSPRSIHNCYCEITACLREIGADSVLQQEVFDRAAATCDYLDSLEVDQIIAYGLHEWLTETIRATNTLAGMMADAYGFNGPTVVEETAQTQTQSM